MNLSEYLHQFNISVPDFAKKVGVEYQTVYRWLDGSREPRDYYKEIYKVTGGLVDPNSLILTDLNERVKRHHIYSRKDNE